MIKRNQSEDRFYKHLIEMGFDPKLIKEPDKIKQSTDNEPDFLVQWFVFEVKQFNLKAGFLFEKQRIEKDLKTKHACAFVAPYLNKTFKLHIKSAKNKFKKYPQHHSVLVEDLTNFGIYEPKMEDLLGGIEQVSISKQTSQVIGHKYIDRTLRTDQYTDIGAIIFLRQHRHRIFHNIMADDSRVSPLSFWKRFIGKFYVEQYVFFNIPNGKMYLRRLLPR